MAHHPKQTIAISSKTVIRRGGIVVLPLKEYQRLLASTVPTYHLKGKSAIRLDRLVEEGLQEYRKGKTRVIRSLAELEMETEK